MAPRERSATASRSPRAEGHVDGHLGGRDQAEAGAHGQDQPSRRTEHVHDGRRRIGDEGVAPAVDVQALRRDEGVVDLVPAAVHRLEVSEPVVALQAPVAAVAHQEAAVGQEADAAGIGELVAVRPRRADAHLHGEEGVEQEDLVLAAVGDRHASVDVHVEGAGRGVVPRIEGREVHHPVAVGPAEVVSDRWRRRRCPGPGPGSRRCARPPAGSCRPGAC